MAEATAEITSALVGHVDATSALRLVADRAAEVSGAALCSSSWPVTNRTRCRSR